MERFAKCSLAFGAATSRSRDTLKLYDALKLIGATDVTCDDALRSAWIQSVSSFDFFLHEIVATEAVFRSKNRLATRNISLPLEATIIEDDIDRHIAIETHIRLGNSYKAFVAPSKLAEVLACFTSDPWEKIVKEFNAATGENNTTKQLKETLGNIWDRRNKIAHEADINPTLSGVELWPMFRVDVNFTIDFIIKLATCIPEVISKPL